ncbi:MAG TPA: hypothetical protein VE733_07205 [Streptosporangiaceae bacterium]|nr:hypothetical protein [Streptosporangiaceae bacterium]
MLGAAAVRGGLYAECPAAARYLAHDNLDAMHEYAGDRISSGSSLS